MLESISKEDNFPVRADKATSLLPSTIQAVMPVRLQFWFLQKQQISMIKKECYIRTS